MNKLTVLFMAANPAQTTRLKLDEEVRAITQKIRASEYRDSLNLISVWAVRPDDLLQYLNQYRPQVVHFSGHGNQDGNITLVGSNGEAKAVTVPAIRALLRTLGDGIRLVVLNACYTKPLAEGITSTVGAVIGMNTSIGDDAAIVFAASLYRAIGFGRSIQEAFEQGKAALLLEDIMEEQTPELLAAEGTDPTQLFLVVSPPGDERLSVRNLLHEIWDELEPDLQDALAMAYNQALRDGRGEIKTRYFFAALARLRPDSLVELLSRIPTSALPKPISPEVTTERTLLEGNPSLSGCVEDSLRHLSAKTSGERRLSSADVFVDIAEYGTGESVAGLRRSGITREKVSEIVDELGMDLVHR